MYYDLDDAETEGLPVPVIFEVSLPGSKWLNNSEGDVQLETKVSIPLWLCKTLSVLRVDDDDPDSTFVRLETPQALSPDVVNTIISDPVSMDLNSESPFYTNFVTEWVHFVERRELLEVFQQMIIKRYRYIENAAIAQSGIEPKFDEFERQIYKTISQAYRDVKEWKES